MRVLNVFLRCKSSRISDGLDKWGVTESGDWDLAKVSGLSPELKELAFSEASEMVEKQGKGQYQEFISFRF